MPNWVERNSKTCVFGAKNSQLRVETSSGSSLANYVIKHDGDELILTQSEAVELAMAILEAAGEFKKVNT